MAKTLIFFVFKFHWLCVTKEVQVSFLYCSEHKNFAVFFPWAFGFIRRHGSLPIHIFTTDVTVYDTENLGNVKSFKLSISITLTIHMIILNRVPFCYQFNLHVLVVDAQLG